MRAVFSSLRFRLILLVLLAVLPALGLILHTNLEQRRQAGADAQQEVLRLVRLAVSDQEQLIDGAHQVLVVLAQLPVVWAGDRAGCQALFADLLAQYPFYTGLSVAAPNGDVFCSAPPITTPTNFSDRAWYRRLVQTNDFVVGGYQTGRISGKPVVVLAYPVLDATGRLQAIVTAGLDLTWLNQLLAEGQLPASSTYIVMDRSGTILARHPDPGAWVGQSMPETPIVQTILAQGEGTTEGIDVDGVRRLYAFTSLSNVPDAGTGVYVGIGLSSDVVFTDADRALARNLTLLGLVTVFALIAAWVVGDLFILRQTNVLLGTTQRLAAGDLGARTGIPYGQGEFGQLAQAFDQMAEALMQREAERKRTEEEIYRQNRKLALLNQIITTSASGLKPEAILNTACRELAWAFDVSQATAALLNQEETTAVVVAEYSSAVLRQSSGQGSEHRRAEGQPSALNETIPVTGNPSFQYLLTHKAPLAVDDAQNDPRLAPIHDLTRQRGTVSLLILPLVIEGDVVGSLSLDAVEPRHFSAEEVSLAWSVADQVAGALAQARLNEGHKRLEEQYHQAQKMEAVGQLTAGIAHDFNNLLTAINGFAALAHFQLPPDDPAQELVEKILDSGRRAADLVRQLLAFSRKQILEPQVLGLNVVVAEMDRLLRRVIGEHIDLKTILAPGLWPVKVDPAQIEQVVVNLAVNARDAMPSGGRLTIETTNVVLGEDYAASHLEAQPGEYVLLAVSDTGVGMSGKVKTRIFEPFFTTKERGKGTGLGLATVYGIVKQSEGHIWVYSEEGHGTTFKIYLPRAEGATQRCDRPPAEREVPSGDETILLVEDNAEVCDLAQRTLQNQGYTVLEARDSREALEFATRHTGPIHLLLTDVVIPGISGKDLAQQLTRTDPDLRTLFMSGYTDETIARHGVLEPGVAFLQKPFSPMELAHKVRQVLDTPQQTLPRGSS